MTAETRMLRRDVRDGRRELSRFEIFHGGVDARMRVVVSMAGSHLGALSQLSRGGVRLSRLHVNVATRSRRRRKRWLEESVGLRQVLDKRPSEFVVSRQLLFVPHAYRGFGHVCLILDIGEMGMTPT